MSRVRRATGQASKCSADRRTASHGATAHPRAAALTEAGSQLTARETGALRRMKPGLQQSTSRRPSTSPTGWAGTTSRWRWRSFRRNRGSTPLREHMTTGGSETHRSRVRRCEPHCSSSSIHAARDLPASSVGARPAATASLSTGTSHACGSMAHATSPSGCAAR